MAQAQTPRDALHQAARRGDVEHLMELLRGGADPNQQEDAFGEMPVHDTSCRLPRVPVCDRSLPIRCRSHFTGSTPLHWAGQFGHLDAARVLLDCGADTAAIERKYGSSPLHTVRPSAQSANYHLTKRRMNPFGWLARRTTAVGAHGLKGNERAAAAQRDAGRGPRRKLLVRPVAVHPLAPAGLLQWARGRGRALHREGR